MIDVVNEVNMFRTYQYLQYIRRNGVIEVHQEPQRHQKMQRSSCRKLSSLRPIQLGETAS